MNSWYKNKKSFAVIFIILVLIIMSLMVANIVKDWIKTEREKAKASQTVTLDMYNASRYFFRVYYPKNWNVSGGTNGFMINPESGLVLEVFPLVKNPITPEPTIEPSPTSTPNVTDGKTAKPTATADPRDGMIRYQHANAFFYYREYTDFGIEKQEPATIAPSATSENVATSTPKITSAPDVSISPTVFKGDSPVSLGYVFDAVCDYIKNQNEEGIIYAIGTPKNVTLGGKQFRKATYTYVNNNGEEKKGDIYVAVRKMAYYVIIFEATETYDLKAYTQYSDEFEQIVSDMLFSVFDY